MSELELVLAGDSAAAPPAAILEGLDSEAAHRAIEGAPHTIYEELWHITFWQQVTLDWIAGLETPVPAHASAGFPGKADAAGEHWDALRQRFFAGNEQAVAAARDKSRLEQPIRCPSRPGLPDLGGVCLAPGSARAPIPGCARGAAAATTATGLRRTRTVRAGLPGP